MSDQLWEEVVQLGYAVACDLDVRRKSYHYYRLDRLRGARLHLLIPLPDEIANYKGELPELVKYFVQRVELLEKAESER